MFESGLFGTGTCMGTKSLGRLIRRYYYEPANPPKCIYPRLAPFRCVVTCECTAVSLGSAVVIHLLLTTYLRLFFVVDEALEDIGEGGGE